MTKRQLTADVQLARLKAAAQLALRLDKALSVMAESIKVAAEQGSAAAVESIADYLSAVDAVEDEDIAHFDAWVAKGRP